MDLEQKKWLSDDKIVSETITTLESHLRIKICVLTNGTVGDIGRLSSRIKKELERKGRSVIELLAEEYLRNRIDINNKYLLLKDPNCHLSSKKRGDEFYTIDVDRCYNGF